MLTKHSYCVILFLIMSCGKEQFNINVLLGSPGAEGGLSVAPLDVEMYRFTPCETLDSMFPANLIFVFSLTSLPLTPLLL